MPERSVAGRSIVTRRAIVDIVRTAVQSSYGVTGFSDPSLGRRVLRWIGLDRPGIKLTTEGGLHLDVFITVAYGADGLCIEAHVEPAKGIGDDPKQALTPEVLAETISQAKQLWAIRRGQKIA